MSSRPRVAFFTDCFHEVNGVAQTSRQFDAFARRQGLPFLSVHAGPETKVTVTGTVATLELHRSGFGFSLDRDMSFDLAFMRHKRRAAGVVREFGADLIHITGPSDVGILGAYLAWELGVPLTASWHTNLHEFGSLRLKKLLSFLPARFREWLAGHTEEGILEACVRFYRLGRIVLAPNPGLVDLLHARTRRPAHLMQRGVDTGLFSPKKRRRDNGVFTLGLVGRLTPEKNVRFLVELERALLASGQTNFGFLIVGDGSERTWLEAHLQQAEFTGVLRGEELSRAYADMDVFVFPSETDTFGNVVLEAFASGVPVIASGLGGPKYLVQYGSTGFVAETPVAFQEAVVRLADDPGLRRRMGANAREYALARSWDRVFFEVYDAYQGCTPAIASPLELVSLGQARR